MIKFLGKFQMKILNRLEVVMISVDDSLRIYYRLPDLPPAPCDAERAVAVSYSTATVRK